MSCENETCSAAWEFENPKDGKHFCSPGCAKEFYRSSKVSVSSESESKFVSVSPDHPAFARMTDGEKNKFLSFGQSIGQSRDYRVHEMIKVALDMIGGSEDDKKKRSAEKDEDPRKKQASSSSASAAAAALPPATPPLTFVDIVPADIQIITLRLLLGNHMTVVPLDRGIYPPFFTTLIFLAMFENAYSQLHNVFISDQSDPDQKYTQSLALFKHFVRGATPGIVDRVEEMGQYEGKMLQLIVKGWAELEKLAAVEGVEGNVPLDILSVRGLASNVFGAASFEKDEQLLVYAYVMNSNVEKQDGQSISLDIFLRLSVTLEGYLVEREYYHGAHIEFFARWINLASLLMEKFRDGRDGEYFNPMADGYKVIELVRQVVYPNSLDKRTAYATSDRVVKAFTFFLKKVFDFQPAGFWVKSSPFNPFRVLPDLYRIKTYHYNNSHSFIETTPTYALSGKTSLTHLEFSVAHIKMYPAAIQVLAFHRFPGRRPTSGRKETIPAGAGDTWKNDARQVAYGYLQTETNPSDHLVGIIEVLIGQALWDVPIDESVMIAANNQLASESLELYTARQNAQKFENLAKLCSYRDQKGNLPTFLMRSAHSTFEVFIQGLKQKVFVLSHYENVLPMLDNLTNPDTKPAVLECYDRNMPRYVKYMYRYSVDRVSELRPIDMFTKGGFNYLFLLYNYVTLKLDIPDHLSSGQHRIGGLPQLLNYHEMSHGIRFGGNSKQRMVLYTSQDKKMQIVLYVFAGEQTVEWESHPNVQIIEMPKNSSGKVVIRQHLMAQVYEAADSPVVMIPPNAEHRVTGTNISFLSTYFPAEDEPVLKINGIPVYQEWGQPRLPPPPVAPMDQ